MMIITGFLQTQFMNNLVIDATRYITWWSQILPGCPVDVPQALRNLSNFSTQLKSYSLKEIHSNSHRCNPNTFAHKCTCKHMMRARARARASCACMCTCALSLGMTPEKDFEFVATINSLLLVDFGNQE